MSQIQYKGMEKVETTNSKYLRLRRLTAQISAECGCSEDYVRKVLNGARTAKTERATTAQKIYAVADRFVNALNSNS